MKSKDLSNLIISLFILAAGVKIVTILARGYITAPAIGISPGIINSIDNVGNLFLIGIGVLILILIPFYLSKRSEESKQKAMKANP